ncbi:MAG: hypothetical protein K6E10_08465 [Eubacterium sp.]|nr:hypothetical protein [Eubacterium sp.]
MKIFRTIYIALFVMICFSLFLLMPLSHSDMSVEKREAASLPKLRTEEGKLNMDFFDQLTDYFSDNFAFRQELATGDAVIKSKLFRTSNNEKAIVGKNEWLYFNGSLDDYFGRNILNDREIYAAAKTISLMQEFSESRGCSFVFTVAPNKNTLYPDNMPDNYIGAQGDTNIELLRNKLSNMTCANGNPINYVDLQATFLAQDKVLYHKWDSHWNNEGAVLAMNTIFNSIGKEHYDYKDEPFSIEANHSGDVWQLIYPSWNRMDENVIYERQHTYTYVNPVESVEDMFIITACQGKEGNVLMFRDSFGNALLPYVADEYANGMFLKGMPLNVKQIEASGTNALIFEIVERNIPNIIAYLPVMDAPVRNLEDISVNSLESETSVEYEDKVSQYVIYGSIDPDYMETDTDIYVKITTGSGDVTYYEASPGAYIKQEAGADLSNNYGAYISKEAIGQDFSVQIIWGENGTFYSTNAIDIVYN